MVNKISILMAIYNCADYLPASIESILGQTVGDFEFIIIDDGSDESVMEILEWYNDRRIKIIRVDENVGLTRCLNIALDVATGNIFARHDGDDIALPDRLAIELPLLTGRTGLVSCWAEPINENGEIIKDDWTEQELQREADEVEKLMSQTNCVLAPGAIFTREVFERIGYFDPEVRYAQDYNYWLRLMNEFTINIVPEVLVQKRVHKESVWGQEEEHDQDWRQIAKDRATTDPTIFQVEHPPFHWRRH